MRQIIFPSPAKAELVEIDLPAFTASDDSVAGPTVSSVVSAGTELGMQYLSDRDFPHRPGYGAVFRVEEVGGVVKDLRPGDHAFCIGKHQSYQRFPRNQVVPLPAGLNPVEASLARMIAISKANLTLCEARPPATAIVSGLGAVGHYAARLFTSAGYSVAGVDPDFDRRRLAEAFGVVITFASIPACEPGWQLKTDLVMECSGDEQAVYDACCIVRKGGEIRLVGVSWKQRRDIPAQSLLRKVFWRHVRLHSGWEWELDWLPSIDRQECYRDNVASILADMAAGILPVKGLYSVASPAECQSVYDQLCHGHAPSLSTVFAWNG
jgi:threonine dehydrogenase-like Zn-dependent dehydrogenase